MPKMRFLSLAIICLCTFGASDAISPKNFMFEDPTREDMRKLLPTMVQGVDRLSNIDPLNILRSVKVGPNGFEKTGDDAHSKLNLTLPNSVRSWHLEAVEEMIDEDEDEIISHLVSLMDKGKEVDERSLPTFVLKYLMAPITPVLNVEPVCFKQSLAYFLNLLRLKLWAIQMLDSTGKMPDGVLSDMTDLCTILDYWVAPDACQADPSLINLPVPRGNTIAFGSFEGCLNVEATRNETEALEWTDFVGQHCLVMLTKADGGAAGPRGAARRQQHGVRMPYLPGWVAGLWPEQLVDVSDFYLDQVTAIWGQCVPSGCTETDVYLNYRDLYEGLHAVGRPLTCQTRETQDKIAELDADSYVVITIFSVIAFLMLLGTLVDVYQQFFPEKELAVTNKDTSEKEPFVLSTLKCFSVNINGTKLLDSNAAAGTDHLTCLSGMRVISMLWIILGHTYLMGGSWLVKNPMKGENMYLGNSKNNYEIIMNSLPAVDTFFFLSGLLVAYHSFVEMEKKRFNIILFYVHRYIRLTIPLALMIAFHVGVSPHLGSGPLWSAVEDSSNACKRNWWTNLLYINNLGAGGGDMCLPVTWFLACDMQFFLLSPLVLVPLHAWRRSPWGLVCWGFAIVAATVVPLALVIEYELPPTHLFPNLLISEHDFDMETDFYMKPWIRAQPYLIGIILGYALFETRRKEIKIHLVLNVFLWLASLATGCAVVFGLSHIRSTNKVSDPSYSLVDSVMYHSLSKVGWSLGLSWVVFACVKGFGGVVDTFLSWGFFLPLARMTYMTFLIHYEFIIMFFYSMTYTIELTDIIASYYYIGFFMISYGIAFVATLTIEAPFIRLEKLVLEKILPKTSSTKLLDSQNEKHVIDSGMAGGKMVHIDDDFIIAAVEAKREENSSVQDLIVQAEIHSLSSSEAGGEADYVDLANARPKVGDNVPTTTL